MPPMPSCVTAGFQYKGEYSVQQRGEMEIARWEQQRPFGVILREEFVYRVNTQTQCIATYQATSRYTSVFG